MTRSNVLPALGEGFRLIRREPLAVLAWGLLSLVVAIVPTVIYFALIGPELFGYYAELGQSLSDSPGAPPSPPSFGAAGLVQLVQWVASVVSAAVIYAAVYRAVIRPEEKGFARMRLGKDELNVGVVVVVLTLLFMVAFGIAMVLAMIPTILIAIAMSAGGAPGEGAVAVVVLLVFAFMIGVALVFSRFAVALPMSFAERRIRIFEAWTFTKGYAGQLALMAFLQVLIIIGIYIAVIAIIGVAAFGTFAGINQEAIDALSAGQIFQRFAGVIVVLVMFYAVLLFVMTPIMLAPWARAYQIIAADRMKVSSELFA